MILMFFGAPMAAIVAALAGGIVGGCVDYGRYRSELDCAD
jgi:hypothetical protein